MSLREFIAIEANIGFNPVSIDEILNNHVDIANEINQKIKPFLMFKNCNNYVAYPFFIEAESEFHNLLQKTISVILESDLIAVLDIDYNHILKLKKLLLLIAESVPFKPNISELSLKIVYIN